MPKAKPIVFTEDEVKLTLNEAVERGELKAVFIDGEIKYVVPEWQPGGCSGDYKI